MLAPRSRRVLALVLTAALGAGVALAPTADARDASVAIDQVSRSGSTLTVTGTADLGAPDAPGLVADAGDSAFVAIGTPARLAGLAMGGADPYTFAWSFDGGADRFDDPAAVSPAFDTTGLPAGPTTVTLTVTDAGGATATDTVQLALYAPVTQTLVDETVDVAGGIPEEDLGLGGTVDQASADYPFTVPAGTLHLSLRLEWTTAVDDFDLRVDDPSDAQDDNTTAATGAQPEVLELDAPAPGDWSALVDTYLSGPDTYHLTVVATTPPPSPLPTVTTPGPFRFEEGDAQDLTATVDGGTDPVDVAWDLDLDGTFESAGTDVTADLPLGNHVVVVKATDAAGYEVREVTAVRVVEPGAVGGTAPLVVIGVSDTGINPYHRDFRADTYPDQRVLDLTANFTRHPSEYIPGYPANARALPITLGDEYYPEQDHALFTRANIPLGQLFWFPGTKIIGAVDAGDTQPVNGNADTIPILDEDGHGTASASVATGNLFGFCPTCLLVFGESFDGDQYMYSQPWIDFTSNSFGSAANVGFPGLDSPAQPKENAEAGQIAFYAAGNGNENAFVTPEQTYTSSNLGPDWIVRVGAVDRTTRKPIVGTGKPVDVASFGNGTIPSADFQSTGGVHNHSGTSSATPYTAGVFGTVLGTIRSRIEDTATGARGDGVIAEGVAVPGSDALADGTLTRAELTDAVFKTAEHDDGSLTSVYPLTTPAGFPAQYLVEGYGLVEPASGQRALDVLLGGAPLPERPDEDAFFAQDEALRDLLWGDWSGGDGATVPEGTAAPTIATLDDALAWMAATFDEDPTAPYRWYLHYTGPCDGSEADHAFMDTTDSTGDADGCGAVGLAGLAGGEAQSYTSSLAVDHDIPAGTPFTGTIYLQTYDPGSVTANLTLLGGGGVVAQGSSDAVVTLGAVDALQDAWMPLTFELQTTAPIEAGDPITLSVGLSAPVTWFFGYEGDHASTFDLGLRGTPGDPGGDPTDPPTPTPPVVQVQVVPAGAEPAADGWVDAVDTSDGGDWSTWTGTLDVGAIDGGSYDVFARLLDDDEVVATSGPTTAARGRGRSRP